MPYYLRLMNTPVLLDHTVSGTKAGNRNGRQTKGTTANSHHGIKKQASTANRNMNSNSNIATTRRVQFKLSVTTDLGDSFYEGDLRIRVVLLFLCETAIHEHKPRDGADGNGADQGDYVCGLGYVEWKSGMRVLNDVVELKTSAEQVLVSHKGLRREYWVSFEVAGDGTDHGRLNRLFVGSVPEVIGLMAPTGLNREGPSEQRVLRTFEISNDVSSVVEHSHLELRIHEEMGESIARHIWDAALALLTVCTDGMHLNESSSSRSGRRNSLFDILSPVFSKFHRLPGQRLQILELGSGCGMVGLGLARVVPDAYFVLTDLPEAMSILDHNISTTNKLGYASGTDVISQVLDWNSALEMQDEDRDLNNVVVPSVQPDLILVSDCTYNPSSFEALVATLVHITKQAHKSCSIEGRTTMDVLVSYKTRHDSESQFFGQMENAGFEILAKGEVMFPDRTRTELGLDLERAEIFAFAFRPGK